MNGKCLAWPTFSSQTHIDTFVTPLVIQYSLIELAHAVSNTSRVDTPHHEEHDAVIHATSTK
jgi:hypothetical protein